MENVLIRARVDIGFSGEIIGRHTNLLLSNINFVPIISSKRFALFLNSFELVFAMPSLILRKEVLHFIKKTKNTLVSPISQTWNIFVHLSTYKHVTARFIYQMTVPVKQREIYSEPIRKVKTTEDTGIS